MVSWIGVYQPNSTAVRYCHLSAFSFEFPFKVSITRPLADIVLLLNRCEISQVNAFTRVWKSLPKRCVFKILIENPKEQTKKKKKKNNIC